MFVLKTVTVTVHCSLIVLKLSLNHNQSINLIHYV